MSNHPPTVASTFEGQRAVRQMRGWAVFIGLVIIVSQSLLGAIFWQLNDQARARCVEGNRTRAAIADGFDTNRRVLLAASRAPGEPPPTVEEQRAIDAYNEGIDQLIARFAPVDC